MKDVAADAAQEEQASQDFADDQAQTWERDVDAGDAEACRERGAGGGEGGVDLQAAEQAHRGRGETLPEQLLEPPLGDDDRDDLQRQECRGQEAAKPWARRSRPRRMGISSRTTCAARSIGFASTEPANDPSSGSQPSARLSQKLLTTFLQAPRSACSAPSDGGGFREEIQELTVAGWTGLEPAASGVTGASRGFRVIRAQTNRKDFGCL
jgi:hypothetical protein